jgi:hypothetical protein
MRGAVTTTSSLVALFSGDEMAGPPGDTNAAPAPDTDPAAAKSDAAAPPPPKFMNELKSIVDNLDAWTMTFWTIARKQDSALTSPAG